MKGTFFMGVGEGFTSLDEQLHDISFGKISTCLPLILNQPTHVPVLAVFHNDDHQLCIRVEKTSRRIHDILMIQLLQPFPLIGSLKI